VKYIFDANTLIYLAKAGLLNFIKKYFVNDINIDTHVYNESVVNAPEDKEDSRIIKEFLAENEIPIIPTQIDKALKIFYDAGEASCYELAGKSDIVVTNDRKAMTRLKKINRDVVTLDDLILKQYSNHYLNKETARIYLEKLKKVHAITPSQLLFYYRKMFQERV